MWFFSKGGGGAIVISTSLPNLLTLKSWIQAEIGKIWKKILQKFYENVLTCFHICMVSNAGYTLCTNLDKSGTNHESCIVYTRVIRVWFVPDLIRDLRFVNSQPLAVLARTIKGHEFDSHWVVFDAFISIPGSCILEDLFWKFLNSSLLINYQQIGLWLFVMVRRWVRKS